MRRATQGSRVRYRRRASQAIAGAVRDVRRIVVTFLPALKSRLRRGMAQAGGTEHFYSASTPAELSSALSTIVGTVAAGCIYPLTSPVANPNALGVYLDKSLVPQSTTEGWIFDAHKRNDSASKGAYGDEPGAAYLSPPESTTKRAERRST
jgi:hypothetical protein